MTFQPLPSEPVRRAQAYWFLASLYARPPGAALLGHMADVVRAGDLDELGPIATALMAMPADCDIDALADRLAVEHARLFGGIREGYGPPPPYASLWCHGMAMEECVAGIIRSYGEASYCHGDHGMPPDHLAEELRFMAALCNGEDAAKACGLQEDADWARDRQAAFLATRLLPWVPGYCAMLADATPEPFFRALAAATAKALEEDASRLMAPAMSFALAPYDRRPSGRLR